ncbi:MAG: hypothetical protein LUG12_08100 [Erysipelotrichaceae bacterium]|nr:hypothetical protein [Erysipelotrichaceae bacterium]
MYTQKLLDEVHELLLNFSHYTDLMTLLSKDEQITYVRSLLDKVVVNPPMYSDAIAKHLINIDSGDPRTLSNLKKLIEVYLELTPQSIDKMDKEMVRPNDNAKTCFLDNLYMIDEHMFLDIESQSKLSSSKQLMNKNLLYQSSVFTNFSTKGKTNEANYHGVIVLCFYEDRYIGHWLKEVSNNKDNHVKVYQPMDYDFGPDDNVDLSIVIVELGKINKIVREKGIDQLSEKEVLSYVIKNAHLVDIDPQVKEHIEILKRKEKVIGDMVDMRDEYLRDAYGQVLMVKDYLERSTERMEGILEDQRVQRKDYYKRVLKRFKMNYGEDPSFLKNLSLEAYKEIYEMIIDDASIDEIKDYVESLK